MDKVLLIPYIIHRLKELGIKDFVLRPRFIKIICTTPNETRTFDLQDHILYPVMISPFILETNNIGVTSLKFTDDANHQEFTNIASPTPGNNFILSRNENLCEFTGHNFEITLACKQPPNPSIITIPFIEVIPNLILNLENE